MHGNFNNVTLRLYKAVQFVKCSFHLQTTGHFFLLFEGGFARAALGFFIMCSQELKQPNMPLHCNALVSMYLYLLSKTGNKKLVSCTAQAQGTVSSICCHHGFIAAESIQDMTPSRLNLLPRLHYHNHIHFGDSDRFHFCFQFFFF